MKNSILSIALSAHFADEKIDSLLEIANATPNPEVAVEILLGVYRCPLIPNEPENLDRFESSKRNIVFKDFNKFENTVHYTYNQMKTKSGWIKNGDEVTVENIAHASRYSDDAANALKIAHEEFKNTYTYHTIDTEMSCNKNGVWEEYVGMCDLITWLDQSRR